MKILTAAQMAETDRRSVAAGVSVDALMEQAGRAVARFCELHYPQARQVTVLCGKGNNGGDGMVAARHLAINGRNVRVALLGKGDELKEAAAHAWWVLQGVHRCDAWEVTEEAGVRAAVAGAELIVDAVVGTGFKPPLRGLAASAKDAVAASNATVVAVDLPSGWDADSREEKSESAFRADAVVTFVAPKLAHVFGQLTRGTFGPVVVAEIGTPAAAMSDEETLTWTGTSKAFTETPRDVNGNKGKFGHVLVVGGSSGTSGAPSMSSLAAMRAGAGLVTAAVPACIADDVARTAPELMLRPLWSNVASRRSAAYGVPSETNLAPERLEELLKGIKVIALGPGLSTRAGAPEFARSLVARTLLPIVIDADGLNAFAGQTEFLHANGRTMVLTPHPGEMARLIGGTVADVEADRLGVARSFAVKHGVTLVLKGWRTLVAHPDGRVAVNTTGNPSMAKGGSGDILTGIVAAMLAQYPEDIAGAVEAAVFLHGLAGDFAVLDQDEHTVLATDTVARLYKAFRARVQDENGFTWIAGLAQGRERA